MQVRVLDDRPGRERVLGAPAAGVSPVPCRVFLTGPPLVAGPFFGGIRVAGPPMLTVPTRPTRFGGQF